MKIHLTSLFQRLFRTDETISIKRTDPVYGFFLTECPYETTKDPSGNLIIRKEKEELIRLKEHIGRVISVGNNSYSYFVNEYRQNSPVRDSYGNIILNDEIVNTMHK